MVLLSCRATATRRWFFRTAAVWAFTGSMFSLYGFISLEIYTYITLNRANFITLLDEHLPIFNRKALGVTVMGCVVLFIQTMSINVMRGQEVVRLRATLKTSTEKILTMSLAVVILLFAGVLCIVYSNGLKPAIAIGLLKTVADYDEKQEARAFVDKIQVVFIEDDHRVSNNYKVVVEGPNRIGSKRREAQCNCVSSCARSVAVRIEMGPSLTPSVSTVRDGPTSIPTAISTAPPEDYEDLSSVDLYGMKNQLPREKTLRDCPHEDTACLYPLSCCFSVECTEYRLAELNIEGDRFHDRWYKRKGCVSALFSAYSGLLEPKLPIFVVFLALGLEIIGLIFAQLTLTGYLTLAESGLSDADESIAWLLPFSYPGPEDLVQHLSDWAAQIYIDKDEVEQKEAGVDQKESDKVPGSKPRTPVQRAAGSGGESRKKKQLRKK
ncbi:hypothetical protein RB195_004145 [Necator americanus]|uniref:Uncharacterized protein n=1 Tax=Necator americanus TaxID=51031 RepID=A0ABR1BGK2_NECAM